MRKLSLIMALGFLATSFTFAAVPASAHGACGRHMHWVPAHRDRMGHWVRGHCSPDRR